MHAAEWEAQSFDSQTGRLGLLLTSKENKKISRIVKVELHEDG